MKKNAFLLMVLTAIIAFACQKEEDPVYQLSVTVNFPDTYNSDVAEGAWVFATETSSGRVDSTQTDANGVALLENLTAGIYNVSATLTLSEAQAETETGVAEVIVLSSAENNFSVLQDSETSLTLQGAVLGGLVFKEVYYTGSKTPEDKNYFSDQYYEIYNNSTDVIYADGLCLGIVDGWATKASISVWLDEYPTKQALQSFWYVPGSGTDHPINPGESIIIAQDGIDHKTDALGNPNSPVDLSDADFETYVPRDDNKDLDAPGVPNMEFGYATFLGFDWLTSVFGCGYVIFRIDGDIDTYVDNNKATKPESTSTTEYVLIDNDMIIDAFQAYADDSETGMPKLHSVNDAGFTFDPNGTYTGKCVRRKVKTVINGRTVYQDTNNSTNDFLNDQECAPRQF
ncbi:MAG: DUF4876 domain-containing protein [Bacteroidota bacterium]